MRDFVRIALTTILEEEVTALMGAAPYEQNPIRRDHRNGSYRRDLDPAWGALQTCASCARDAAFAPKSSHAINGVAPKWTKALAKCLSKASARRGWDAWSKTSPALTHRPTPSRGSFIAWKTNSRHGNHANGLSTSTFILKISRAGSPRCACLISHWINASKRARV